MQDLALDLKQQNLKAFTHSYVFLGWKPANLLYMDQQHVLRLLFSILIITQALLNITLYEPSEHLVDIITNNVVKFGT